MYFVLCMWCFQPQRRRPLALFAWYLPHITPPSWGKLKYFMDARSSRQHPYIFLWMRSSTRRSSNCSARGRGVAEGTSRGKSATKIVATATRVGNAGKIVRMIFLFLFLFLICAAIKKLPRYRRPRFGWPREWQYLVDTARDGAGRQVEQANASRLSFPPLAGFGTEREARALYGFSALYKYQVKTNPLIVILCSVLRSGNSGRFSPLKTVSTIFGGRNTWNECEVTFYSSERVEETEK